LHFTHCEGFLFICVQIFSSLLYIFHQSVFFCYIIYISFTFFLCSYLFSIIVVAILSERMARLLKRQGALAMDEREEMDSPTPPVSPSTIPIPATPAVRPNQLPIAHPLRPAEPQPVTSSPTCGVEDGDMTEAHDGIGKLMAALSGISPG
jgi:hypothetical protein